MRILKTMQMILFAWGAVSLSQLSYASAAKCYTASKTMQKEGEQYYNLDNLHQVSADQQKALTKLQDSLEGDYEGSYSEYYCTGPESDLKEFLDKADLKLEIEASSRAGLKLKLEKKYLDSRVTKTDKITLLDPNYLFDLSIDGQDVRSIEKYRRGFVSKTNKPRQDKGPIPELYDQVVGNLPEPDCNPGIELYSKNAKPTCKEYGSRFAEIQYSISQQGAKSYQITIETYYNGYLSHVQWLDIKEK